MCKDCWHNYESPAFVNEAIRQAVTFIAQVYDGTYVDGEHYPGNACGGNLHTILSDWNLEFDETRDYTPTYTDAPHQHAVERACYDQLRQMTVAERAAALAWYDGYITDEVPGAPAERSWSAGVRRG